jgi:two-component system response regulator FixJ
MSNPTVYILDDNADFRDSARFWLQGAGYAVQAWADPREALQALGSRDRRTPACMLLDVRMPHMSGLDVHDALRAGGERLPVIYMSGHADVPLAVQAMQKGAVTFLEKPFDDAALEAALQVAFDRGAVEPQVSVPVPPEANHGAPGAVDGSAEEFAQREASLTPREREVLNYVVQGIYNKVIADRIQLSIKTVELYRARGLAKMKARSVAELTRMMVSRRA